METYFLIIVIILFVFAISDLVVGVSNDAVNFLNSALGSKAAPFKLIMFIAACGILVGATFSSGMMEVARKGIFHPDMFLFSEIMIIFLAVMLTDIILLDVFNTLALPTSTTVSIVFELLGAAVAISILKVAGSGEGLENVANYINSGKALTIISGILLSVFIAFTIGAIIMYIVRMAFTFNYEKTYKYFGAIWGGLAITAITYFMLIKGAKGSSFMTPEIVGWIKSNTIWILLISFIGWGVILQLLLTFTRINILKVIVLVGTFALAMAFASNDLVNFIGVPLAGLESFKSFIANPGADAGIMTMEALKGPVQTPTILLLVAGLIMVAALVFSKKARAVTQTELNLSRQDEGKERFESSVLARHLVRNAVTFSKIFNVVLPRRMSVSLEKRFKQKVFEKRRKKEGLSFDLIRASVNLVVASILVAIGTSLKLPLSTTYVTFMVAMGTSLADRAWGRESAVNRITGVLTVVGGWFVTAFSAFTVAFLVAMIIHWGRMPAITILVLFAIFFLYKTHTLHKKREAEGKLEEEAELLKVHKDGLSVTESSEIIIIKTLKTVTRLYDQTIFGLINEKRKKLKNTLKETKVLDKEIKDLKADIFKTVSLLPESEIETGQHYIHVLDSLGEISHCLSSIIRPVFDYIDDQRPTLLKVQKKDLTEFNNEVNIFLSCLSDTIKSQKYKELDKVIKLQWSLDNMIIKMNKEQLKLMKKEQVGKRVSMIYLNTLGESRNLLQNIGILAGSHKDFVSSKR